MDCYSVFIRKAILDEPRGHCAERNKPVTDKQIPHGSTYLRCPEESRSQGKEGTGSRRVGARCWGRGIGSCHLTGTKSQFGKKKRI